ncbi:MAG: HPr family phosphocarrier protein [Oscillospiraceae bacterium]|nr:HPr family phosphocarrier protein [Oscillospiraceae bacterium]
MKQFTYTITDPIGLHARPAGFLLRKAKAYQSTILVQAPNGRTANALKLMALMGMGAKVNEELVFTVEGEDEEKAAAELAAYLPEIL